MAILAPDAAFRLRGAFSFGSALIFGRLVQAVAFFVMAHRFSEAQMGVLAVLTVLFVGFFQLTNLGFDRYVVYEKDSDPAALKRTIDTVWTMQLARGVLVIAAAIPVTLIVNGFPGFDFGSGEILGVAVAVAILSLVNPGLSAFERGGDFSFIARARALSVTTGALLTILLVLVWAEPWVYVLGQIANALTFASVSFLCCAERPSVSLDLARMRQVFRYSKHLVVIAGVSFLSAQFQNLYIGAVFGSATLGLFFTWLRTVTLPQEVLSEFLGRILYAKANDRARHDGAFAQAHLVGFAVTSGLLAPFYFFVWFHGDVMITHLAGEKWLSYWWAGRVMVAISAAYALSGTIGPFTLTICPHFTSLLRTVEALSILGLILLLAPEHGVAGVLVSILAVLTAAVLARIFVFYRLIVTQGRLDHARQCLGILATTVLPYLAAEFTFMPLAEVAAGKFAALGTYMVILLLTILIGQRYYISHLKPSP